MDMRSVEDDILADLHELDDPVLQYGYLAGCAGEAAAFPEHLRDDAHLVRECQARTWIPVEHDGEGRAAVLGDSESIAVQGALALIEEVYNGRTAIERAAHVCLLLDDPAFARHFTKLQMKGLGAAVALIASAP